MTLEQDASLCLQMAESQFVLLTSQDGEDFRTTNPFTIAEEIRRLVGDVYQAKPTGSGKLLIQTKTQQQADVLLQ